MKVALINMPFGRVEFASLGLTQLQTVLSSMKDKGITTDLLYLNHDFAQYFGLDYYNILLGNSVYIKQPKQQTSVSPFRKTEIGLFETREFEQAGEWLFRQLAFPNASDNAQTYLDTYFTSSPEVASNLLGKRDALDDFLNTIIDQYHLGQYEVVCFTSMFQQQLPICAMSRKLKEYNPAVVTMAGGPNFDDGVGVQWLEVCPSLDFVLEGSGHISLPALIRQIQKHGAEPLCLPAGVISRFDQSSAGKEGLTQSINDVIDLDYSGFLNSFETKFAHLPIEPVLFFETSRGCWWGEKKQCSFCDYTRNKMDYFTMGPERAIIYINGILDRYHDRCRYFWSVDAAMNSSYVRSVFPYLHRYKDISLFFETRCTLSSDDIHAMANAGVDRVQAGIEAMSTYVLKKINKGTDVFDNLYFLKYCAQYGVSVLWNLLAGIPGIDSERYVEQYQLIQIIHHFYPPTGMWSISYDRHSDYVVNPSKYSLRLEPNVDLLRFSFPFDTECLEKLAYFYKNLNQDTDYTLQSVKFISRINKVIKQWQNKWKSRDNEHQPRLYVDISEKKKWIVDSRGEKVLRLMVSDMEYELLVFLDREKSLEGIRREFEPADIDAMLERFVQLALVWQEEGKFISLVMLESPRLPVEYQLLKGWVWE